MLPTTSETVTAVPHMPAHAAGRRRWRAIKDALARRFVALGGVGVIAAILLIFFYLLYEILPLFAPAELAPRAAYTAPGGGGETRHLAVEEQAEIAVRFTGDGEAVFFRVASGEVVARESFRGGQVGGAAVTTVADAGGDRLAIGFADGRALMVRHAYEVSYPDNVRHIAPKLEYPFGDLPLAIDPQGRAIERIALSGDETGVLAAALLADGTLMLAAWEVEASFLTGETTLVPKGSVELAEIVSSHHPPRFLLIDPQRQWLFAAAEDGELLYYDVRDPGQPVLLQRVRLVSHDERLTALAFLSGGISLLAGTSSGRVMQWFPVRDADNRYTLEPVREFPAVKQAGAVSAFASEPRRKGFITAHATGHVSLYYATSERLLRSERISDAPLTTVAIAPRNDFLIAQDVTGRVHAWTVHNEHPEVSWQALWGKVWYESYPAPDFIWQSSAATNDFEPKFSLTPLAFGTLKAAFYAMLFAIPLGLMGAIYTAYFMTPRLRQLVKPTVEIMAALPSVILGFLAGLWLAPFMEAHMPGVFLLLLLLPLAMLLFGYVWSHMPAWLRHRFGEGWFAVLLVPVIAVTAWLAFTLSGPIEIWLFGGNMPNWVTQTLGIGYDQRNALVVGIAMGFAVIPIIFSIAEDAIFGVPRHLSDGSLALGATPWQTLVRVVLPTASPGIFSALMIGLGRAVGETMIVLMATGNTPVMNFNLFEGMRTLSANIAVEMPESEVGSTHYRLLCLAALVLFLFTFVLNTAAEIVRQRLREKYSHL